MKKKKTTILRRCKIFILGVAGFCGRHFEKFIFANQLSDSNVFIGVDIDIARAAHSGCIQYREGDLTDIFFLRKILINERPDYILNLAGLFGAECFSKLFEINVEVSRKILELVSERIITVKNILLIGSAAEYGEVQKNPVSEASPLAPRSYYGLTKAFQSELSLFFFRNYGLPVTIARPFNIFGNGISTKLAPGAWQKQIAASCDGDEIVVGNLSAKRDFIDITDVVFFMWHILMKGKPGEIYNICTGKPCMMGDLLDQMIRDSGKKLVVRCDPELIKSDGVSEIYGDPRKLNQLMI